VYGFRSPLPPFPGTRALHALRDTLRNHTVRNHTVRNHTVRNHTVRNPSGRPVRLTLAAAAGTMAADVTAMTRWRPSRLTLVEAAVTIATAVTAITRRQLMLVAAAATMVITVAALVAALAFGGTASPADSGGNAAINASAAAAEGQAAQTAPRAVSGQQTAGQQPAPAARPAQAAAPAQQAQPAQPAPAAQPYLIYDSVTPGAIPPGPMIATYATGNDPTSAADVAGRQVMWIDVTGTDYAASALDVEPGNVGPAQAATWAYGRLSRYPNQLAVIYTFQAEWPEVQAAVATLPAWMQSRIRWWIADPTGVPHMLPGAQATQWYWGPGYDISTAMPGF